MSAQAALRDAAADHGWLIHVDNDTELHVRGGNRWVKVRYTPTGQVKFALSHDRVYGGRDLRGQVLGCLVRGPRFVSRRGGHASLAYGVWDQDLQRFCLKTTTESSAVLDRDALNRVGYVAAELVDGVPVHTITDADMSDEDCHTFTQTSESFRSGDILVYRLHVAIMDAAWPYAITRGDTGFDRLPYNWRTYEEGLWEGLYETAATVARARGFHVQCVEIHPEAVIEGTRTRWLPCVHVENHDGDHVDRADRRWPGTDAPQASTN